MTAQPMHGADGEGLRLFADCPVCDVCGLNDGVLILFPTEEPDPKFICQECYKKDEEARG